MNDDNHKTLQEFAMGEIIKGLRAERDALKAELEEKNTELKKWKYVPGVMHCAKCNFQLIKSVLNMHRGTVTAGDSNPELCPNGCGPLWRVSWEKYANDHYEDGVKTFEKLRATEAELEAARKQEPAIYRLRYTEATSGWVDVTKDVYDRHKDNQNYDAKVFYASPVPAQQSAEVNQEYPMQPMFLDKGLPRFEKNPIIDRLCEKHGLNEIGIWWQVNNIERKYIEQLYQLIGYSIRGYDELSEVSDASFERANAMAEQLLKGGER